jgi:CBS domain containing-hemolysin-like protein
MFGMKAASGHGLVHSEEELKMLVTASQQAGVLEEEEEQMLHRVFHFAEFTAAEMMVPRTEMTAVRADASIGDVVDLVWRGRHSSLPVYRGELDNIIGIMLVPDLVRALGSPSQRFNVGALAREALTVPTTLGADELLGEMRRRGVREAIVIDEYGGTAGLVTFESLMERIVGTIEGEFGGPAQIAARHDGSADIDGLTLVGDVNTQFGLHIDEETYNTVGGYVLGRLGRRARLGDTFDVEGRRMRVEQLDGLRVARVWLSKPGRSNTTKDTGEKQGG